MRRGGPETNRMGERGRDRYDSVCPIYSFKSAAIVSSFNHQDFTKLMEQVIKEKERRLKKKQVWAKACLRDLSMLHLHFNRLLTELSTSGLKRQWFVCSLFIGVT